jgi:hypothetical protein
VLLQLIQGIPCLLRATRKTSLQLFNGQSGVLKIDFSRCLHCRSQHQYTILGMGRTHVLNDLRKLASFP